LDNGIMRDSERHYLDLMTDILEHGDARIDRTGVGTRSVFGASIRFDLSDGSFPVLTTKRVFWKLAVKEMLWFLTGGTNIQPLLKENVRIWSDWPLASYNAQAQTPLSQEAFEARVLEDDLFAAKWGELGPVYGKQWRRWVGPDGREHDQIASVVDQLKHNPASRRMLFHAWNPAEIGAMALPPCHMVYQYHVSSKGALNCLLYQRSCDLLLGAPFNFVGACALQLMLAQQAGLTPGQFVWVGGDVHLYMNHLEQAKTQIARAPRTFPKMRLTRHPSSIDGYHIDDFALSDYDPHPAISAPVAV
jgi:thymidylate synthase